MNGIKRFVAFALMSAATMLQAQQVIDPLTEKHLANVEYLTGNAVNLNEKVYLFAKEKTNDYVKDLATHFILEFDPKTQVQRKIADVRRSHFPRKEKYGSYQPDLPEEGIKIGNRLLLKIAPVGYVEWFDPKSESFYSAFAQQPQEELKNCSIQGWENGPLLYCDLNTEGNSLVFRLDAADGLFHPFATTLKASDQIIVKEGLFCLGKTCHEWPNSQKYSLQDESLPTQVVIKHQQLFWFLGNGNVVMQKRHSNEQTILNTAALNAEPNKFQVIGISPNHLLYVTKDENGRASQFKRLHFASQKIAQIDTTIFDNNRNWDGSLLVCTQSYSCAQGLPDDSFVMFYGRGGIAQLQSTSTQFSSLQQPWFTSKDYCCHGYVDVKPVELNEQLFYVANSCLFVYGSPANNLTARECKGKAPSYLVLPSTKLLELAQVQVTNRTPIRGLITWKDTLLWLEQNEQWRVKSFNPKTQQTSVLDTFSDNLSAKHLMLLPGSTNLWHLRYNKIHRFNPDTQRFEATTTVLEEYQGSDGMLIGDSFYYLSHKEGYEGDTYINTARLNHFDLISGQVQNLKWLPPSSSAIRLLGISNGKVYLSEGILNLSDLAYTANKALARKMESAGGAMVEPTFSNLLKVFEYRQQLFGIAEHYESGWDSGGIFTRNLVKLDLNNQTRNLPKGKPVHFDAYDRPEPRVIQNGDFLFGSWGQQFQPDGTPAQQQFTGEFFSNSIQFLDSTYLLSENQLGQWKQVNGKPVLQGNLLPAQQFADIGASMVELGGKLYYVATDNADGERIRQIQLPNRPPVVKNESATTNNTTKITIAVLANDADPDFDLLTVADVKATQGLVSILPDQQLSYQPKAGFSGTDDIQYQVTDGRGGVTTGKVSVTITATATEVPPVTKPEAPAEKSGGGFGFGWLALLWLAVGFRRHLSATT